MILASQHPPKQSAIGELERLRGGERHRALDDGRKTLACAAGALNRDPDDVDAPGDFVRMSDSRHLDCLHDPQAMGREQTLRIPVLRLLANQDHATSGSIIYKSVHQHDGISTVGEQFDQTAGLRSFNQIDRRLRLPQPCDDRNPGSVVASKFLSQANDARYQNALRYSRSKVTLRKWVAHEMQGS